MTPSQSDFRHLMNHERPLVPAMRGALLFSWFHSLVAVGAGEGDLDGHFCLRQLLKIGEILPQFATFPLYG